MKSKMKNNQKIRKTNFKVIAIVSVGLNVLLLGSYIAAAVVIKNGALDYAQVNYGLDMACSDEFRNKVENDAKKQGLNDNEIKTRLAILDYPCARGEANTFYANGYEAYAKSIGLEN